MVQVKGGQRPLFKWSLFVPPCLFPTTGAIPFSSRSLAAPRLVAAGRPSPCPTANRSLLHHTREQADYAFR